MMRPLHLILVAGAAAGILVSVAALYGAIIIADRQGWSHPVLTVAVAALLSLGLALAFNRLAWVIGDKIDPYIPGQD